MLENVNRASPSLKLLEEKCSNNSLARTSKVFISLISRAS